MEGFVAALTMLVIGTCKDMEDFQICFRKWPEGWDNDSYEYLCLSHCLIAETICQTLPTLKKKDLF